MTNCFLYSFSLTAKITLKLFIVSANWREKKAKYRSSHRRCFVRKGPRRNSPKLTRKYLCQSLIFNKIAGLRPANLLKKKPWHRCFPVNFAKRLRTPFLQNTSRRLLLEIDQFVQKVVPAEKNVR